MSISKTDATFLNQVFRKMLTSQGIREGLFENVFSSLDDFTIDTQMTIYVESTGNDLVLAH